LREDKTTLPRHYWVVTEFTGSGDRLAIVYRRGGPADVPAASALPQPGEAGGDPPDRMLTYLAGESHPRQALPPRAMWIAELDGALIGYAAGHLTRRYDCDGELQWIYVVREHRRAHVATELLRLVASWFIEQNALRICVDVGDEAARPFYRRLGAVDLNKHWMVWKDISQLESLNSKAPRE
jgi:GNAT superfamily N-acetyltransferase